MDTLRQGLDLHGCDRIIIREFNVYDDLIAEYQVGEDWTPDELDPECESFSVLTERKLSAINYN